MVTWGFPMTWDPWDPKIRQVTKASTVLSRQVQRPVLSPPDQILEQMQRTADGDKQNQLPNEIQRHPKRWQILSMVTNMGLQHVTTEMRL